MGLDIAFDRRKAMEAGIEVNRVWIDYSDSDGPSYEDEVIRVPGMDGWVSNAGVIPACGMPVHDGPAYEYDKFDFVVRANKWGRTYGPLTNWLKENSITWDEF